MGSGGSSSGRPQSPRRAAEDGEEEPQAAEDGEEKPRAADREEEPQAADREAPSAGSKADPGAPPKEVLDLPPPAPPKDKPCPLPPTPEAPPRRPIPPELDATSRSNSGAASLSLSASLPWQLTPGPPELRRYVSEAEKLARAIRLSPTDVHTAEEARMRRQELSCRWRAPLPHKDIWGATVRGIGEQLKHDHNVMHRLEAGVRARRKAAKDRGSSDSSSSKRNSRWRKRMSGHRESKVTTIAEGDEEEKEEAAELEDRDARRYGKHDGSPKEAALAQEAPSASELAQRRRTPSFGPSSVAALAASRAVVQAEEKETKALVETPRKEVAVPVPVDEEELEYGAAGLALLVQAARHRVATERFWSLGGSGERPDFHKDAAAIWNAEWQASANPLLAAKEWSSPGWVTDLKAPDGTFGDRPASASTAAPSTFTARSTTSSITTAASSHAPFLCGSLPRKDFGSGGWTDSLMQKAGGARRPWSAMAKVSEPGSMRAPADKKHLVDRRISSPLPPGSRAMCPHPHAIDVAEEERLPSDLYLSDLDRYLMNKTPCLPPFDEPMFTDNYNHASFPT